MSEIPVEPPPIEPGPSGPAERIVAPPIPAPPEKPPAPEPVPAPTPVPAPEPVPAPPELPGLPGVIPDLGIIGGLLVVLGLIALASALVDFFNWLFRFMFGPLFRRRGTPTLTPQLITQPLSNALGRWEAKVDKQLALSFHKIALVVGRTGRAITTGAQVSHQLALRLARVTHHSTVQDTQAVHTAATAASAHADALHAGQAAAAVALKTGASLEAVTDQVNALSHSITHLIEPELEALRGRIPHLETGVAHLWDEIEQHSAALGIDALTAATAIGMGRLGADWVTCEATQLLGRNACRQGSNFWRDLLGLTLAGMAIGDACAIIKAVIAGADAASPVLDLIATGATDLLACLGAEQPLPMIVHQHAFATGQPFAEFALA